MNFNTPATQHMGIVKNQETVKKIINKIPKRYRSFI